jgi:hypothetical protein
VMMTARTPSLKASNRLVPTVVSGVGESEASLTCTVPFLSQDNTGLARPHRGD